MTIRGVLTTGRAGVLGMFVMLGGAAPALAGTQMVMETSRLSDGKLLDRSVLRIDGPRLRLDSGGGKSSIVYHADQRLVWMLDHDDQSYIEVDQETTAGIARSLDNVNKELRGRLDALPADQRAAAEKLLNQTLGPSSEVKRPEVVIVPTGGSETLEGTDCRVFDVLRDGERVADVCKAEFAALGVGAETLSAVGDLSTFLRETVTSLAPKSVRGQGLDALDSFERIDGVPLRVRAYEGGTAVRQSRIRDLETLDFPASDFRVPDNYSKQVGLNIRNHIGGP